MTRTAYVKFRDNAFWVYDVPGSIFLWFLIQSAENFLAANPNAWLEEMISKWRVSAVITEMACYANDEWSAEQIEIVVQLCRDTTAVIREHGDFSARDVESWPVLDDQRIFVRGHDPIPSEPVALLAEAFTLLLRSELPEPPEKHFWFYTLDDEADTIKMNAT